MMGFGIFALVYFFGGFALDAAERIIAMKKNNNKQKTVRVVNKNDN